MAWNALWCFMMPLVVTAVRSFDEFVSTAAEATPTVASAVINAKASTMATFILRIHPPVNLLVSSWPYLLLIGGLTPSLASNRCIIYPQREGHIRHMAYLLCYLGVARGSELPRIPLLRLYENSVVEASRC